MSRGNVPNHRVSVLFHFLVDDFFGCHAKRDGVVVHVGKRSDE